MALTAARMAPWQGGVDTYYWSYIEDDTHFRAVAVTFTVEIKIQHTLIIKDTGISYAKPTPIAISATCMAVCEWQGDPIL